MANEITISGSLQYANPARNISNKALSVSNVKATITGYNYTSGTMTVPTTAGGTAIPLASLTSVGWAIFKNNDATNYVEIMTAVSGSKFAQILPGECTLLRFSPSVTAPAAIAHTASIELEFLILEI